MSYYTLTIKKKGETTGETYKMTMDDCHASAFWGLQQFLQQNGSDYEIEFKDNEEDEIHDFEMYT